MFKVTFGYIYFQSSPTASKPAPPETVEGFFDKVIKMIPKEVFENVKKYKVIYPSKPRG